jgi:hypothetical protein
MHRGIEEGSFGRLELGRKAGMRTLILAERRPAPREVS